MEKDQNLQLPIEVLELRVRPFYRLHKGGVRTLGQLADQTEEELQERYMLKACWIQEIKSKLQTYGLQLRDNGLGY